MTSPEYDAGKIRALNDQFRTNMDRNLGDIVFVGEIVSDTAAQIIALSLVRTFDEFDEDNDPRAEHDFSAVTVNKAQVFWKIDYYDPSMTSGARDPADPTSCRRLLSIFWATDY